MDFGSFLLWLVVNVDVGTRVTVCILLCCPVLPTLKLQLAMCFFLLDEIHDDATSDRKSVV